MAASTKTTDSGNDPSSLVRALKDSYEHSLAASSGMVKHDIVRRSRTIDWRVPTIMVLAFLAGLAFAIGHHYYYAHFDGDTVASDAQQQWIVRGGSAFAFCFKVCLAASTGTAFAQILWLSLSRNAHKVSNIDSMFGILNNALLCSNLKLWLRHPVLWAIAVITWIVPWSAIVTPGTIVVRPALAYNTESLMVPRLDLNSNASLYRQIQVGFGSQQQLGNIEQDVLRIGYASATSVSILTMQPPRANCSYSLVFTGPALRCAAAPPSEESAFNTAVSDFLHQESAEVEYFSWAPNSDKGLGRSAFNDSSPSLDYYSISGARLYVYASSSVWREKSVFVKCALYNATYNVDFDFENTRNQRFHVRSMKYLNAVTGNVAPATDTGNSFPPGAAAYLAIMEILGRLVVGKAIFYPMWQGGGYTTDDVETMYGTTALSKLMFQANTRTLASAVEELYFNMTMSLFSSKQYLVNDTTAAAQHLPQTEVLVQRSQNVYLYAPRSLYIAYSVALLAAGVCVALGFQGLMRNGRSYSISFSTILRTTRDAGLDQVVFRDEYDGAEPLPEKLGSTKLVYVADPGGCQDVINRWSGFTLR